MLSNTATPKYYGAFKEAVIRGEIPVNEKISLQMNIIDSLIENPNYYYDDKAIDGYIAFCENELTLVDGSDLHLLDSYKLWAEDILSWFYFVEKDVYDPDAYDGAGGMVKKVIKKRLRNKQYLILGRGGAKTLYGTTIHSYFLVVDSSTTRQITTSPTVRQSNEMLMPLKTAMARAKGPVLKFLTSGSKFNTNGPESSKQQLIPIKDGIVNKITNSDLTIYPLSIDKLQGLRTKVATLDEWLSGDLREDPISAIEQGAAKVDNFLIIAMSSEGTVRNGVGDTIKMELMKILKREYPTDKVSIFWYCLDNIKELSDPKMWPKANPNLGYTVDYETYQDELERAEQAPAVRNDILAKRFGLPMEGFTYFFTYEETQRIRNRRLSFDGMSCALGLDLSQGDDFCSFTFLFPLNDGHFGVKTRNYITSHTYGKLPLAMKLKYNDFQEENTLVIVDGVNLDMNDIYDDVERFINDHEYNVCCLGYDPYNAKDFLNRWTMEYSSYGVEKVIQGVKSETVPLGELKNLAEVGNLLFDEAIMEFAMGNCITIEDTNGNRKLLKKRHEAKIDCVAAMMDAYIAYKLYKDLFA